jgi:hypothetical protein
MVEKRELEAGGATEEAAAKKPRSDGPAKPGLSLEALEKAKKALQMQKELKEKLKKLPQVSEVICALGIDTDHGGSVDGVVITEL